MRNIDLRGKLFAILGLHQTGKTYLAKNKICKNYNTLVFDYHDEYDSSENVDTYYPKHRSYPEIAVEHDKLIEVKRQELKNKYDIFITDEAPNVYPNKRPLKPNQQELLSNHSHYPVGWGNICRSPADLNTDLLKKAQYMFIFRLTGKPDLDRLNAEIKGLADAVRNLKGHDCIVVYPDRTYQKIPE